MSAPRYDWDAYGLFQDTMNENACRDHAAPTLGADVDPFQYQADNDLDCESMPCREGCPLRVGSPQVEKESGSPQVEKEPELAQKR